MDWLIAALIVGIGAVLALNRSSWLVDYTVYVVVLNRGLRRIADWHAGAFNPLSPISLSPLVVASLMFLVFIGRFYGIPLWGRRIFVPLCGAVIYAGVIGLIRIRFAALYAIAEVTGPLALLGYVFIYNASQPLRDRWIRSFAWAAILVSAYGWYQYLTIPPWDAFWLVSVNMVGYMGIPEPTKMTVFSTMGERGVLAGFLGFSIVPMIVSPRWRTACSWPGVILVISVILLTQSRGGVLIALVATLLFVLVNRGANALQVAVAASIIGAGVWLGFDKLPNAEALGKRFDTLGNMGEDGSYIGRVQIFTTSWTGILKNPFGYGLGASGLSGRINTGTSSGQAVIGDAGYLEIAFTYGWLGTMLLLLGLWRAWKRIGRLFRSNFLRTDHVLLARSLMVAMIPACFAGNFLGGLSIFWLALGCALSPTDRHRRIIAHERQHALNSPLSEEPATSVPPANLT